jgi:hypothetical protein
LEISLPVFEGRENGSVPRARRHASVKVPSPCRVIGQRVPGETTRYLLFEQGAATVSRMSPAVRASAFVLLLVWVLACILHGDTPLAGFELGLLVPSVLILALLPAKGETPRAPTILACALRAPLGATVFAAGALIRVNFAGGVVYLEPWELVLTLATFGVALGPLAVFEHGPGLGTTRRSAILVAASAGWTATVLLAVAWVQACYVRAILDGQGAASALYGAYNAGWTLIVDPGSTIRHILAVVLPVGAAIYPRLRGWALPRQAALVLVGSAASFSLLAWSSRGWTLYEPKDVVGLAGLGAFLPLVFSSADLLAKRFGAEESPEPSRRTPFWVAVLLSILAALLLLAREAYRWRRRIALAPAFEAKLAKFAAEDATAPCAALQARLSLLEKECDADRRSAETGERVWPDLLECDKEVGVLAAHARALSREVNDAAEVLRENGGDAGGLDGPHYYWKVYAPIHELERRIRVLKQRVIGMRFPAQDR